MERRIMTNPPSPEQAARLERQRLAAEDGAKALQEVASRAIAIRENMARVRSLRLAKEAQKVRANDRKSSGTSQTEKAT